MQRQDRTPYHELDPNIIPLVRALNRYPCVTTVLSCGGHEVITHATQWPAGTWYVKFDIAPSQASWRVLEFLAGAVNLDLRGAAQHVGLLPVDPRPLRFVLVGYEGVDPDYTARFLTREREKLMLSRTDL